MPTIIEGDFIMRNVQMSIPLILLCLLTACSSNPSESNIEEQEEPIIIEEQIIIEEKELVTKNEINKSDYQKINNLTEGKDDMKVELLGTIKNIHEYNKYIEIMLDDCNNTAYPLIVVVPTAILNNDIEFQEGEEIIVYGRIDGLNYLKYKEEEVPYIKLAAYGIEK